MLIVTSLTHISFVFGYKIKIRIYYVLLYLTHTHTAVEETILEPNTNLIFFLISKKKTQTKRTCPY